MNDLFGINRRSKAFSTLQKKMPTVLGGVAKSFFLGSFRNQGFTDASLVKWKEVNRRIEGTKEYMYPKTKRLGRRTKAINVNTGRLRRSIVIKNKSLAAVVIASIGVPYAADVNEARPFMGDSVKLRILVKKKIKKEFDKILKGK